MTILASITGNSYFSRVFRAKGFMYLAHKKPLPPRTPGLAHKKPKGLPLDVEAFTSTVSAEKFEPCLNGSKTGSLKILIHRQRCAAKLAA